MKRNYSNIPFNEPAEGERKQAALDAIESAQRCLDFACRCLCSSDDFQEERSAVVKLADGADAVWHELEMHKFTLRGVPCNH